MPENPIIIKLSDHALDELARCKSREERGRKLLELIEPLVRDMDRWAERTLGGPGAKIENQWLRTFLYKTITGELKEDGDIEKLPVVAVEHPAFT